MADCPHCGAPSDYWDRLESAVCDADNALHDSNDQAVRIADLTNEVALLKAKLVISRDWARHLRRRARTLARRLTQVSTLMKLKLPPKIQSELLSLFFKHQHSWEDVVTKIKQVVMTLEAEDPKGFKRTARTLVRGMTFLAADLGGSPALQGYIAERLKNWGFDGEA